jgi:hypothetical protein
MSWTAANAWAANLTFHDSVRNVDYSDWRLAANTPVGADWNYENRFDGTSDRGWNITSPNNELSYMYYVNLGLKGSLSKSGGFQVDYGLFGNGTEGGQTDVGPVKNLQSVFYWSGTAYAATGAIDAWMFYPGAGYSSRYDKDIELSGAWAVRPGDVAAVPEPEFYALLLAGLGLLGVVARRRKQQSAV